MGYDIHRTRARLFRTAKYDDMISSIDTLLPDETLLHLHLGLVVYTEGCQIIDKLSDFNDQITVMTDNIQITANMIELLRKGNDGSFNIKLYTWKAP